MPVHASTRKRKRRALYAWELYGAKPPRFWIAASHTTGDDEWKDGVLRIGTYWFGATRPDPATTFCPQLWELFHSPPAPAKAGLYPY